MLAIDAWTYTSQTLLRASHAILWGGGANYEKNPKNIILYNKFIR